MRLFCLIAAVGGLALTAAAQTNAAWSYEGKTGPLNWGKLDHAYKACSDGHEQSPINIRGARLNKSLQPVEYHYMGGSITLENDGHAIIAHVHPGSYILVDGARYDLKWFDFHRPSEEAVNGKLTDLDVHLFHESSDGKMVMIAVRFALDRGEANSLLAALWPHLPAAPGSTAKITDMIDPGGFLPEDRGYWTYMGSLTTPPCTEGVRWIVYQDPLTISLSQVRAFDRLFHINSRQLQDTHGRRIEANE